jgi:hypothetical protein
MSAGYSGKPLVVKLGIKPGAKALIVGAPRGYRATLSDLPPGVRPVASGAGPFDFIQLFSRSAAVLVRTLPKMKRLLAQDGMLWVSWPKRASALETDIDENVVRDAGLGVGLVDVKVCAVDETWSGLKFVIRLKDRSG